MSFKHVSLLVCLFVCMSVSKILPQHDGLVTPSNLKRYILYEVKGFHVSSNPLLKSMGYKVFVYL